MSAKPGNQWWKLRSKHGRDRLFASGTLLLEAAFEYFQWCDDNPWTVKEITTKAEKNKKGKTTGTTEETKKEKPTARPYTLEGLTLYVGASVSWWRNFRKNLDPEKAADNDFLTVMEQVQQIIDQNQLEGATVGAFNANIIARKLGLVDRSEAVQINREAKALTDQEVKDLNERLNNDY